MVLMLNLQDRGQFRWNSFWAWVMPLAIREHYQSSVPECGVFYLVVLPGALLPDISCVACVGIDEHTQILTDV